jgi:hypothetical protein
MGCCGVDLGQGCCRGVGSRQDCIWVALEPGCCAESELGCCMESELACGEVESRRRLGVDFFFLTFFMVGPPSPNVDLHGAASSSGSLLERSAALCPRSMALASDWMQVP